jgi:hypothetical protein
MTDIDCFRRVPEVLQSRNFVTPTSLRCDSNTFRKQVTDIAVEASVFQWSVVYLTTLSVAQTIQCRLIGWLMNWKGHGRKRSWYKYRYYPGIFLEGLNKTTEISVRISGLRAEIWIKDLSNIRPIASYSTATFGAAYVQSTVITQTIDYIFHKRAVYNTIFHTGLG